MLAKFRIGSTSELSYLGIVSTRLWLQLGGFHHFSLGGTYAARTTERSAEMNVVDEDLSVRYSHGDTHRCQQNIYSHLPLFLLHKPAGDKLCHICYILGSLPSDGMITCLFRRISATCQ
jgi:hypothetical protein